MLLFKTCFYVNIISLYCAVHTAMHVLARVLYRERLLFKSCFCVTARFEKSASIRASIQVMLLYATLQYAHMYTALLDLVIRRVLAHYLNPVSNLYLEV